MDCVFIVNIGVMFADTSIALFVRLSSSLGRSNFELSTSNVSRSLRIKERHRSKRLSFSAINVPFANPRIQEKGLNLISIMQRNSAVKSVLLFRKTIFDNIIRQAIAQSVRIVSFAIFKDFFL